VTLSGTKHTTCFVCGPDNPLGLQVPFEPDGEAGSTATYVARKEHGGWNGILHGGVVFALMDEAFGWCLYFQRIPSVTARIQTSFHQPIPIGTHLHIRAWVTGQRRKLFDAKAEVRLDNVSGLLVAEPNAVLYTVPAPEICKQQNAMEAP
jgi:acyl-coenzyme A thioesterase PaaI-like protein